jgi:hypothetical protein
VTDDIDLEELRDRLITTERKVDAFQHQLDAVRETAEEARALAEDASDQADEFEDLVGMLGSIQRNAADVTTRRAVLLVRRLRDRARTNGQRSDATAEAASLTISEAHLVLDEEPDRTSMYDILPAVAQLAGEAVEYISEDRSSDRNTRLVLTDETAAPDVIGGFATDPEQAVKVPDIAARSAGGAD